MLIILEGCDGGGKTTLAAALQERLEARGEKVTLLKRGVPTMDVLDEYTLDLEDYVPGTGHHVICDRWHWGERVYSEIYRDGSELGVAGFRFVELFLAARGGLVVLVDPGEGEILRRLNHRGDDYIDLKDVPQIIESYVDVRDSSLVYSDAVTVDEILVDAEYREGQAGLLRWPTTYVGPAVPKVLLVGDGRLHPETSVSFSAFQPRQKAGCAEYLLESLPITVWRQFGVCNGNEEPDLGGLVETLTPSRVVALGRKASDRLLEIDVEHGGVPHPQYARRFHAAKKHLYGELVSWVGDTGEARFSWPK